MESLVPNMEWSCIVTVCSVAVATAQSVVVAMSRRASIANRCVKNSLISSELSHKEVKT